jgi:MscS family membrane protein
VVCLLLCVLPAIALGQGTAAGAAKAQPPAPAPDDPLGRGTPRGTVVGFLNAARSGENLLARQYLNTAANAEQSDLLARQLFEVLDARFPARLAAISDAPEGSRRNPLAPDQEVVGTIATSQGTLDIVVERVQRGSAGPVWLFSRATLAATPAVHQEVLHLRSATALQRFVERTPLRHSRLLDWLVVLLGVVVFYFLTLLLNRLVTPLAARGWRRVVGRPNAWSDGVLPMPARLLLIVLAGRWVLSNLALSLFVRQFWGSAASVVTIVSVVWLLILANGEVEAQLLGRVARTGTPAAASLLRLLRRGADALVVFFGLFAMLRLFAVDATPALAGLGVGGIAVALAAQKTLENVIAGASLIFDQAVQVGDFLRMGEFSGTVEHIGLRSTRLRTMDRTVVSVPNAQIANAALETLSARDKFWFHHVVGLTYDTTPDQLTRALEGLRQLLRQHPAVDPATIRVRFIRLGPFSMDVDVFAYLTAADYNEFLVFQEGLLFGLTDAIHRAGTEIAFPTQTMKMERT